MGKTQVIGIVVIVIFILFGCSSGDYQTSSSIESTATTNINDSNQTPMQGTVIVPSPTIKKIYTQLFTPTPEVAQTATPTIQPTESFSINTLLTSINQNTQESPDEVLYFFSNFLISYGFLRQTDPQLDVDNLLASVTNLPMGNGFQFAHHLPLIAYVDGAETLWVADLALHYPVHLANLPQEDDFQLTWTPDDRYLLVLGRETRANYLLDIQSGELREFPYRCTTLARSTRSQLVAIWCPVEDEETRYAVWEWGKPIWYASHDPQEVFLIEPRIESLYGSIDMLPLLAGAGWSSDGSQIAYYDRQDPQGSLVIMDAEGEHLVEFPRKAYWMSEYGQQYPSEAEFALTWSQDNQKIVLYGLGTPEQACPPIYDELSGEPINDPSPPCWQVLDMENDEIVWMLNDLLEIRPRYRGIPEYTYYERPVLSSDAELITIYSFVPADPRLFTMEIDTNELVMDVLTRVDSYRWWREPKK